MEWKILEQSVTLAKLNYIFGEVLENTVILIHQMSYLSN